MDAPYIGSAYLEAMTMIEPFEFGGVFPFKFIYIGGH